ncbi:MAG: PAS domain S-box protein [Magnetococcales bacterium]|nr:PAS domain S-box protein [Magnetococcales bacterium]
MKLSSKLYLIGLLPFLVTCLAGLFYLLGQHNLDAVREQAIRTDALYKSIANLAMSSHEYVVLANERREGQWRSQFALVTQGLHRVQARLALPEEQMLYAEIEEDLDLAARLFEEYVAIQQNSLEKARSAGMHTPYANGLGVRLSLTLRGTLPLVERLHEMSHQRALTQEQRQNWIGWGLLVCLVLMLPHLTRVMVRHMTRSLGLFRLSMAEVAAGNLSQRITFTGQDELAVLSAHFNQMTAQLESTMVSRDRLQASEQRLREITDTLGEGLFVLDRQGHLIFCNPTTQTLLGWSAAELMGRDVHALFHLHHATTACPVWQTLHTGRPQRSEQEQFRCQDGTELPVSVIASPIQSHGEITGVVVAFSDNTERFHAQQYLAELLDFNQKIVAASTAGITVYQANGACILANEAAARIAGATVAQLLAQNYRTVVTWRESALLQTAELALASGRVHRCEIHIRTTFGKEVWLECDLIPFSSKGEAHLMLMMNDITSYRQAEQLLIEARQSAEHTTRLKSEFLANMSHEIRTPMHAILGLTQLALGMELTPRVMDYLTKVHLSARSLLGIINDILDYSKIEAGHVTLEAVDFALEQLLDTTTTLFAASALEKAIALRVEIKPSAPRFLHGDPLRLGQILNNLVGNAIKFTQTGLVQVEVDGTVHPEGRVALQVVVRDTGIGMTEAQMAQLFRPFQQADGSITRRYGGTGLGLAITRSLVEQMEGTIAVESQLNAGSCFRLQVWMGEAVSAEPRPAAPKVMATPVERMRPVRGGRILLAEDNEINQLVAMTFLQQMGLQVTVAGDGQQAIAALQREPFDLVLMDLHMPQMDGLEATRRIRRETAWRELPIIAMTAAALAQDRAEALAVGMNEHITKPIDLEQLADLLLAWLPHRTGSEAEEPVATAKPAEPAGLPDHLPGFDWERGVATLGGDGRLWRRLVVRFAEDFAQAEAELAACVVRRDREAERQQVHRLRGVAGNLGALSLSAAAAMLEERLQTNKPVHAARKRLRQALAEALASARSLGDGAASAGAGLSVARVSSDRLFDPVAAQALLCRLAEHVERKKFVAEFLVEETRTLFAQSSHIEVVEALLRKLDLFDFEGAEPLLRQLQEGVRVQRTGGE